MSHLLLERRYSFYVTSGEDNAGRSSVAIRLDIKLTGTRVFSAHEPVMQGGGFVVLRPSAAVVT
jgi:hypothetical protein